MQKGISECTTYESILPCINGLCCCWWSNGVGNIFAAYFGPLITPLNTIAYPEYCYWACKYPSDGCFQQNNVACHKAHIISTRLLINWCTPTDRLPCIANPSTFVSYCKSLPVLCNQKFPHSTSGQLDDQVITQRMSEWEQWPLQLLALICWMWKESMQSLGNHRFFLVAKSLPAFFYSSMTGP